LSTTTGSGKYNFVVSFDINAFFYTCFVAMIHYQTELSLLPCTTALPTSIGSGGYIFVVSV